MEVRYATGPNDMKYYTTQRLREEYLIPEVFKADDVTYVYSHYDRIITGGAMPVNKVLKLSAGDELRAEYFLQRREMGIINIGGAGKITVDGKEYLLEKPLKADVALIGANISDEDGNLIYIGTSQNFCPLMATAAETVIVEPQEIVKTGTLAHEHIKTPGIFVDYIVKK